MGWDDLSATAGNQKQATIVNVGLSRSRAYIRASCNQRSLASLDRRCGATLPSVPERHRLLLWHRWMTLADVSL